MERCYSLFSEWKPHASQKSRKTEDEWRAILTPEQFQISRLHGTERPHTGALCAIFDEGIYQCVCCDTQLFDASIKFDSSSDGQVLRNPSKKTPSNISKTQPMEWCGLKFCVIPVMDI